ncbi:MAG TPA: hypothetical protein VJT31_05530 [Rugosimonospora sp.]|nr:hypothetical protein [Rugosimonospora sp.]
MAATHPQPVLIHAGQPGGYLLDVHACASYGDRFTVLEADTVCYPGSLRNFLLLADQLGDRHDLCVGVAPAVANPNGPALVSDRDGRITAMSWHAQPSGLVPLAAWHWSARLLEAAPPFAQRTGSTSTADYVTWAVQRGAAVAGIGIPAGVNINTPADLGAARSGAAGWLAPTATITDESLTDDRRLAS